MTTTIKKHSPYGYIPPEMIILDGTTHTDYNFVALVNVRELLVDLLRAHRGNTLWSLAITAAAEVDSPERWERLIEQLASQAKDNVECMKRIVGNFAAELLLAIGTKKVL